MEGCVAGITSRERVLAALSHRQPDRVPLENVLTMFEHARGFVP
jgi:hypothetical protein